MSTDLTDYGIDFRAPVLPRPPIDYSQEAFDRFKASPAALASSNNDAFAIGIPVSSFITV